MHINHIHLYLEASLLSVGIAWGQNAINETRVNITALASRNGYSVIECWQLGWVGEYAHSATNWVASGNLTQAIYSIIEPKTTPGEAWAPSYQLTMILNGLIRITTPYAPSPLNETVAMDMKSNTVMSSSSDDTMTTNAKSLDDAPAPGQRVEWQGKSYTTIQEGRAYILVPETETDNKKDSVNANAGPVRTVFYNPIQQFNRDLTVLAISAYGEELVEARKKKSEARAKKNAGKKKRLQEKTASAEEAQAGEGVADAQDQGDSGVKRKREDDDEDEEPSKVARPNDSASPQEVRSNSETGPGEPAEKDADNDANGAPESLNGDKKKKAFVPRFTILDALSASGLRALRYASEIPFVSKVTANDLDPAATEAISRNARHNKLQSKINVTHGNAIAHMYSKIAASMALTEKEMAQGKSEKYDVVDLDPYGTAATFLDAAVQAVHDSGGLLCVTCTDAGVWASNSYPEKSFALYGGVPIKGWHSHEVGLRLILHAINAAAARYGLFMEPLLSLSIDFYARVFVRIKKSPAAVKFSAGKTMITYNCDAGCGAWTTQPLLKNKHYPNKKGQGSFYKHQFSQGPTADQNCEHCGFKTHLAGPMYAGRLHDPEFIKRILAKLPEVDKAVYGTTDRIKGMLTTALEEHLEASDADSALTSREAKWAEIEPYPFYFSPTNLSKIVHCATPSENVFRGALRGLGYRVTRSHCKPGSIKTDAPWAVLWHILREYIRQKAPIKESSIQPGSPGFKILKMHTRAGSVQEVAEDQTTGLDETAVEKKAGEYPSVENLDSKEKEQDVELKLPEVVFDEALGREKNKEKLVRYQMNPRENWGPMNRARGS
ncbi:RNA methyltransferase tRNA(m5U54)methyltransferase [Gnomoniopsis smithogilvyi]|uniref:tRNA (guanine(26)-N(2))-dimethyltransferase n=1 Tax=Gnomoniopsis smithogilvyi TaxID=1191159 RepID=A0A9W8YQI5_9PEZI|nr:RNA methyltransferase tRNA(m5U54)methyltransferase [Gnomoniopsis smithogilvyi]